MLVGWNVMAVLPPDNGLCAIGIFLGETRRRFLSRLAPAAVPKEFLPLLNRLRGVTATPSLHTLQLFFRAARLDASCHAYRASLV